MCVRALACLCVIFFCLPSQYRWVVVRSYCPHWLLWHLFNISFICLYQNLLLLLLVAPSLALPYIDAPAPLNWLDAVATVAFLAFLAGETVCDQQQWNVGLAFYSPARVVFLSIFFS